VAVIAKSVDETLWHCVRALTVSQLVDECHICRRAAVSKSELCTLHLQAMKNIEDQYQRWRTAFGEEMGRLEYFDQLLCLEETGVAVKKVIEYLRRKQPEAI